LFIFLLVKDVGIKLENLFRERWLVLPLFLCAYLWDLRVKSFHTVNVRDSFLKAVILKVERDLDIVFLHIGCYKIPWGAYIQQINFLNIGNQLGLFSVLDALAIGPWQCSCNQGDV
jgi:hypothetical protein